MTLSLCLMCLLDLWHGIWAKHPKTVIKKITQVEIWRLAHCVSVLDIVWDGDFGFLGVIWVIGGPLRLLTEQSQVVEINYTRVVIMLLCNSWNFRFSLVFLGTFFPSNRMITFTNICKPLRSIRVNRCLWKWVFHDKIFRCLICRCTLIVSFLLFTTLLTLTGVLHRCLFPGIRLCCSCWPTSRKL